jgi:hypothetical protein
MAYFVRGKLYQEPSDQSHHSMYLSGAAITVISAAAITAACTVSFPLAGPISLLTLGVLTAVGYGIANDLLACRQCIQYFTWGHTKFHKRLLKTDNPTLNAVVWGIHATWKLGAIAGVLFALSALATGLAVMPILPYLALAKTAGSVIALSYGHYLSKKEEAKWNLPENQVALYRQFDNKFILTQDNNYDIVPLGQVPDNKRAAYLAVGLRNAAGYRVMPLFGLIMMIAITVLGLVL